MQVFFGRILGILDLGFCMIRKQFFTWGPERPKFWISAEDFGFWGFWILGILDFRFWGFWILDCGDFGFWDFGDFGFWGFWILGILDFWIFGTLCSRSLCAKFGFWNLGILDFGDFGFWGSWILDFGLGILDGHLVTKFWMLHKKRRLCTPNRVGGFTCFLDMLVCWQHSQGSEFNFYASAFVGIILMQVSFVAPSLAPFQSSFVPCGGTFRSSCPQLSGGDWIYAVSIALSGSAPLAGVLDDSKPQGFFSWFVSPYLTSGILENGRYTSAWRGLVSRSWDPFFACCFCFKRLLVGPKYNPQQNQIIECKSSSQDLYCNASYYDCILQKQSDCYKFKQFQTVVPKQNINILYINHKEPQVTNYTGMFPKTLMRLSPVRCPTERLLPPEQRWFRSRVDGTRFLTVWPWQWHRPHLWSRYFERAKNGRSCQADDCMSIQI